MPGASLPCLHHCQPTPGVAHSRVSATGLSARARILRLGEPLRHDVIELVRGHAVLPAAAPSSVAPLRCGEQVPWDGSRGRAWLIGGKRRWQWDRVAPPAPVSFSLEPLLCARVLPYQGGPVSRGLLASEGWGFLWVAQRLATEPPAAQRGMRMSTCDGHSAAAAGGGMAGHRRQEAAYLKGSGTAGRGFGLVFPWTAGQGTEAGLGFAGTGTRGEHVVAVQMGRGGVAESEAKEARSSGELPPWLGGGRGRGTSPEQREAEGDSEDPWHSVGRSSVTSTTQAAPGATAAAAAGGLKRSSGVLGCVDSVPENGSEVGLEQSERAPEGKKPGSVAQLCAALVESKGKSLKPLLLGLQKRLGARGAETTVTHLLLLQEHQLAFAVMRWCHQHVDGFTPSQRTLVSLCLACAESLSMRDMRESYSFALSLGLVPPRHVYEAMISALVRFSRLKGGKKPIRTHQQQHGTALEVAWHMYGQMQQLLGQGSCSGAVMSQLLESTLANGNSTVDALRAEKLVRDMRAAGVQFTQSMYTRMIQLAVEEEDPQRAYELAKGMRQAGMDLERKTLESLVLLCRKQASVSTAAAGGGGGEAGATKGMDVRRGMGRSGDGIGGWGESEEQGKGLSVRGGEVLTASHLSHISLWCLGDEEFSRLHPSWALVGAAMETCNAAQMYEQSLALWDGLQQKTRQMPLELDPSVHSPLLSALVNAARVDEACKLLGRMIRARCMPEEEVLLEFLTMGSTRWGRGDMWGGSVELVCSELEECGLPVEERVRVVRVMWALSLGSPDWLCWAYALVMKSLRERLAAAGAPFLGDLVIPTEPPPWPSVQQQQQQHGDELSPRQPGKELSHSKGGLAPRPWSSRQETKREVVADGGVVLEGKLPFAKGVGGGDGELLSDGLGAEGGGVDGHDDMLPRVHLPHILLWPTLSEADCVDLLAKSLRAHGKDHQTQLLTVYWQELRKNKLQGSRDGLTRQPGASSARPAPAHGKEQSPYKSSLKLEPQQRQAIAGLMLAGAQAVSYDGKRTYALRFPAPSTSPRPKAVMKYLRAVLLDWCTADGDARDARPRATAAGVEPTASGNAGTSNKGQDFGVAREEAKPQLEFETCSSGTFNFFAHQYCPEGRNVVPRLVHRWLNPRSLAFWYMYGGRRCPETGGLIFQANEFTAAEVRLLVTPLEVQISECSRKVCEDRRVELRFVGQAALKLWDMMRPHVPKELRPTLRPKLEDKGPEA